MRMAFRLDLAALLVAIAGGFIWIEQSHRVVIDAPAAATLATAAGCPDNDTMPYGDRCLAVLNLTGRPRLPAVVSPAAASPCPDTDQVPYPAGCVAFLKGATETGMR